MKDFIRRFRHNLSFRDLVPLLVLVALVVLGVIGCFYLTPMLGHIDWSGVYGHG